MKLKTKIYLTTIAILVVIFSILGIVIFQTQNLGEYYNRLVKYKLMQPI